MTQLILKAYEERKALWEHLPESGYLDALDKATQMIVSALQIGNKVLIAGNGGSAADAQHFAAELVGRFQMERRALPAIALTVDTSILTSVANDYTFDSVFSRQVEALGQPGDVFVGISTSGTSSNVTKAVLASREKGMHVIGMCGDKKNGGDLADLSDVLLMVPEARTALVQEIHEFSFHTICDLVEKYFFCED